jgi:SAM-dependent methyltransferase
VAIANAEQAAAWDGEEGDRWTEHEERYNATMRRHGRRLLESARIAADSRVLDIGCGCGESTRDAARIAVSGGALGVDLSGRMLKRARERARAEGVANATFVQADAQVHPFEAEAFDLAISRFGAMFFEDRVAAYRNIGRALRPGGRLAILAWQELRKNGWIVALREALAVGRVLPEPPAGAPGPFGLADPDLTRRILAEAGFEDVSLTEIREPMWLGESADAAFGYIRTMGMTHGMLRDLDAAAQAQALAALQATLRAHETGQGVLFDSAAWLIEAQKG